MNNEMINININLVADVNINTFIKYDKEVTIGNFTFVKNMVVERNI